MKENEVLQVASLILFWSLIPMLTALNNGDIVGSPYTDLYPSVWSLWATESWWGTWQNSWFNYPQGQPWSPSTLLWGTLIIPFKPFASMCTLYNLSIFCNRVLGGLSFYLAGRSVSKSKNLNIQHTIGLCWMMILSMHPMIQGYAVEGIFEGTQIWPLGFWIWTIHRNHRSHWFFGALIVLSSWYLSVIWFVFCLYHLCFQREYTKQVRQSLWMSLLLCTPWIVHFLGVSSNRIDLPSDVYREMGFSFSLGAPYWLKEPNHFAFSNYFGWVSSIFLCYHLRRLGRFHFMLLILTGFILSIGFPIVQELPILGAMRFPYRLHFLTMLGIAMGISQVIEEKTIQRQHWLPWLIAMEFFTCSSIPFLLPSAPSEYPNYIQQIDGPVLELPGPLFFPPGQINPSRPRMRYLQYYQTKHQQPSAWGLDFNGLYSPQDCFIESRRVDPYTPKSNSMDEVTDDNSTTLHKACWTNIKWVSIHNQNPALNELLLELNFQKFSTTEGTILWKRAEE